MIAKKAATPLFETKELAADEGVELASEAEAELGDEDEGVDEVVEPVLVPVDFGPVTLGITPEETPELVAVADTVPLVAEAPVENGIVLIPVGVPEAEMVPPVEEK
jgi:hypothetical protein